MLLMMMMTMMIVVTLAAAAAAYAEEVVKEDEAVNDCGGHLGGNQEDENRCVVDEGDLLFSWHPLLHNQISSGYECGRLLQLLTAVVEFGCRWMNEEFFFS